MKKKLILIALIFVMALTVLSACDIDANGSIKSITKPYITEYECIEGYLGGENLLDSYEFITITLVDDKEMQVSTIELYLEQVQEEIKNAQENFKRNGKLYRMMGVMAGIFLVILML